MEGHREVQTELSWLLSFEIVAETQSLFCGLEGVLVVTEFGKNKSNEMEGISENWAEILGKLLSKGSADFNSSLKRFRCLGEMPRILK